jgi:hypothetical protein
MTVITIAIMAGNVIVTGIAAIAMGTAIAVIAAAIKPGYLMPQKFSPAGSLRTAGECYGGRH